MKSYLRLVALLLGLIVTAMVTDFLNKYFTEYRHLLQLQFLTWGTIGSMTFCSVTVLVLRLAKRWRLRSFGSIVLFAARGKHWKIPREVPWLLFSGFCTAWIVPATTLMKTVNGFNVAIATVSIKAVLIPAGLVFDSVKKQRVTYFLWIAAVLAILSLGVGLFFGSREGQSFWESSFIMTMWLGTMLVYPARMYRMRCYMVERCPDYKLHPKHNSSDVWAWMAIEQLFAAMFVGAALIVIGATSLGNEYHQVREIRQGLHNLNWVAMIGGIPYGIYAFFAVMLMLNKDSATFGAVCAKLGAVIGSGLACYATYRWLGSRRPEIKDWVSFIIVIVATIFVVLHDRQLKLEKLAAASTVATPPTPVRRPSVTTVPSVAQ